MRYFAHAFKIKVLLNALFLCCAGEAQCDFISNLSSASKRPTRTDENANGAVFFLNQAGLDLVAEEMRERLLTPIDDYPIADFSTQVRYGINFDVAARGLTFSATFPSLDITAKDDALSTSLGVRYLFIDIAEIEISKMMMFKVSTVCKDISIAIALNEPTYFTAKLPIAVSDHEVQVTMEDADFAIAEDDLMLVGPGKCSGPFGIGKILSVVVNAALQNSAEQISEAVTAKAETMIPELGNHLNHLTHQSFPVRLPLHPDLPPLQSLITVAPDDVRIDSDGLRASFYVEPKPIHPSGIAPDWSDANKIGYTGFNFSALEKVLKNWLDNLDRKILAGTLFPEVDEMLTDEVAYKIWPDLKTRELSSPHLRIVFDFPEDPTFAAWDNTLQLKFPHLTLRLQIHTGDSWVDYYAVDANIRAFLQMTLDDDGVNVAVDHLRHKISGRWLMDVQDKTANLHPLMHLIDFVCLQMTKWPTLFSVAIPTFDTGLNKIKVTGISVSYPASLMFELSRDPFH